MSYVSLARAIPQLDLRTLARRSLSRWSSRCTSSASQRRHPTTAAEALQGAVTAIDAAGWGSPARSTRRCSVAEAARRCRSTRADTPESSMQYVNPVRASAPTMPMARHAHRHRECARAVALSDSGEQRRRPLVDHETVAPLIGATRTTTGLGVRAKLDERVFPKGVEVTHEELAEVNGEWDYTIAPRRRRQS